MEMKDILRSREMIRSSNCPNREKKAISDAVYSIYVVRIKLRSSGATCFCFFFFLKITEQGVLNKS